MKRNINLFYRCKAVKDVNLSFDDCNWSIDLFKGNNPEWAQKAVHDLIHDIESVLAKSNFKCHKNLKIKFNKEKTTDIPDEYLDLWKLYKKKPELLSNEDKTKLAEYINTYGLI